MAHCFLRLPEPNHIQVFILATIAKRNIKVKADIMKAACKLGYESRRQAFYKTFSVVTNRGWVTVGQDGMELTERGNLVLENAMQFYAALI